MMLRLDKRCPICGDRLVLRETRKYVELLCPTCMLACRLDKRNVRKYVKGDTFNWAGLIEDLYLTFRKYVPLLAKPRRVREFDKRANVFKHVR